MDTLFSLKVFRQVVQSGGFTRAAGALGISTAMASKHVSHLENTVQAKLLHRNSRNLSLTEAGEEYYRQCSYALDTLDDAAQKAAGGTEKPQGLLRVTMPLWFAGSQICNWLAEYRERYPEVTLELILDNRHVDLIAEGVDLALRVSQTLSPSLIARPLAEIEFALLASPDFLRRNGVPETPEEVAGLPAVLPTYTNQQKLDLTRKSDGKKYRLELTPVIRTDNTLMMREMIKAGACIGYQPLWAAEHDLRCGTLVRLLPGYAVPTDRLNAVYADRAFLSAKVRSFIDFLNEKNRQQERLPKCRLKPPAPFMRTRAPHTRSSGSAKTSASATTPPYAPPLPKVCPLSVFGLTMPKQTTLAAPRSTANPPPNSPKGLQGAASRSTRRHRLPSSSGSPSASISAPSSPTNPILLPTNSPTTPFGMNWTNTASR